VISIREALTAMTGITMMMMMMPTGKVSHLYAEDGGKEGKVEEEGSWGVRREAGKMTQSMTKIKPTSSTLTTTHAPSALTSTSQVSRYGYFPAFTRITPIASSHG
jgi:hypothetical protein